MEADERTKDWAARENEKDEREKQEAAEAREKSERDARLKDKGGIVLFEQLHAWMKGQAKSYSGIKVGAEIEEWGGPDAHRFFKVSDTAGERLPMTISYRSAPAPYGITVECSGVVPKPQYFLSIGDNGKPFFETPKRQSKTIEEIGSELLDLWKGAPM
jgi:hypothetical protein